MPRRRARDQLLGCRRPRHATGTSTINLGSTTLIKQVQGGDGDDNITGNFSANLIYGSQGTDTISSSAGNDYIYAARDGEVDHVNCGSSLSGSQDHDYVSYDPFGPVSANREEQIPVTP